MNRNPKSHHLKRIAAPRHWLLDKLSGVWAPRPSPGPHKLRECLPIIIMLRNRLKYALTGREVKMIVMARHIRVDGKVRTDTKYPCGFQDVVTINRTGEHFRLIYDTKGRFNLHRIPVQDANWKLCKIVKKAVGARGIPYIVTHDGRTISYPDPNIFIGDTIKYDFLTGKILDIVHSRLGTLCMVIHGRNIGRVGVVEKFEKHPGSFDIVYIRDAKDNKFATRKDNIVIGQGKTPLITLPKTQGIKDDIFVDREKRLKRQEHPIPNQNKRRELAGKGIVLPPKVAELRAQTKEKRKLLKQIRSEDKVKRKPKVSKKKLKKAKKAKEAAAGGAAASGGAEQA